MSWMNLNIYNILKDHMRDEDAISVSTQLTEMISKRDEEIESLTIRNLVQKINSRECALIQDDMNRFHIVRYSVAEKGFIDETGELVGDVIGLIGIKAEKIPPVQDPRAEWWRRSNNTIINN